MLESESTEFRVLRRLTFGKVFVFSNFSLAIVQTKIQLNWLIRLPQIIAETSGMQTDSQFTVLHCYMLLWVMFIAFK